MRLLLMLSLWLASATLAQSAEDIIMQVQTNLEVSPWQALVTGTLAMSKDDVQVTEFLIQSLTTPKRTARIEFYLPESIADNFVVVTDDATWNYLFLTNQLIISSRDKAEVEGVGGYLLNMGDFEVLLEGLSFTLQGEVETSDGLAWQLSGISDDDSLGFALMDVQISQSDPHPIFIELSDTSGDVLAELRFQDFTRGSFNAEDLSDYPFDAEVIGE
jgi:hypothetical protein